MTPMKVFFFSFIFISVTVFSWVVCVQVIFFVRHEDFKEFVQLSDQQLLEYISQEDLVQVGWINRGKRRNSFRNFPMKKEPGKIRVGVFGGSYVEGSEVDLEDDLFSIVQEKFNINGIENIEMLNFGAGAFGMHQSFITWKIFAKAYELDHAIFMPFHFHTKRDRNFIHSPLPAPGRLGPVHSIFINDENGLKQITVVGKSRFAAVLWYYSILMPLRYIRYSNYLPGILHTLTFDWNSYHMNPFYYYRKGKEEINNQTLLTYIKIFNEVAKESTSLLVLCHSDQICNLSSKVTAQNIIFYRIKSHELIQDTYNFYSAVCCHRSFAGNDLISNDILNLYLGNENYSQKTIKADSVIVDEGCKDFNLHELNGDLTLKVNNSIALSLVKPKHNRAGESHFSAVSIKKITGDSLILVEPRAGAHIELVSAGKKFIPNQAILLEVETDKRSYQINIGPIIQVSSTLFSLRLLSAISTEDGIEKVHFKPGEINSVSIRSKEKILRVSIPQLALEGRLVKVKKHFSVFTLQIQNGYGYYYFRAKDGDRFHTNNLKSDGPIVLAWETHDHKLHECNLLNYKLTKTEMHIEKKVLNKIKAYYTGG